MRQDWAVNVIILSSTSSISPIPLENLAALWGSTPTYESVLGGLHGVFMRATSEGRATPLPLRGAVVADASELAQKLSEIDPDGGPILLVVSFSNSEGLPEVLTSLIWLENTLARHRERVPIRMVLALPRGLSPRLLERIQKFKAPVGTLWFETEDTVNYEGAEGLLDGWEPPVNPWDEIKGEASNRIREFGQSLGLSEDFSISAWVSHIERGALLLSSWRANDLPPHELLGTAIMFFAMEEMGQVPLDSVAFRVQDAGSVLLSVRDKEQGKLIGVLLLIGPKANNVLPESGVALGHAVRELFLQYRSNEEQENSTMASKDEFKTILQILSDVALDSCAYRLESYIPGTKMVREALTNPNEPSKTIAAGGTQTFSTIGSGEFSLIFQLNFFEGNLQPLVSQALRCPPEETTLGVIRDFFREYLNQVMGWVQRAMAEEGLKLKIGIPLTITHEEKVPSFLGGLIYDAAAIFRHENYRFEVRVCIQLLQPEKLVYIHPKDVRDLKPLNQVDDELEFFN